jgi:hypothetical protein
VRCSQHPAIPVNLQYAGCWKRVDNIVGVASLYWLCSATGFIWYLQEC